MVSVSSFLSLLVLYYILLRITVVKSDCKKQVGFDIKENDLIEIYNRDEPDCCQLCVDNAFCKAYAWLNRVCYLKSDTGPIIEKVGVTIGILGNDETKKESSDQATCGKPEVTAKLTASVIFPLRNSWPWHVRIEDEHGKTFSGILISNNHVITSNMLLEHPAESYTVTLGIDYFNNRPLYTFIEANVIKGHKSKDGRLIILTLDRYVETSRNIEPICVNPNFELQSTDVCYIVTKRDQTYWQTQMKLASDDKCKESFPELKQSKAVCVWTVSNRTDPKYTSLGTPLYCAKNKQWYLYGMADRLKKQNTVNVPGNYLLIKSYWEFISSVLKEPGLPQARPIPSIGDCGVPNTNPSTTATKRVPVAPHSWPWVVEILTNYGGSEWRTACMGSLLSDTKIVTAASCFTQSQNITNYKVVLGSDLRDIKEISELERKIAALKFVATKKELSSGIVSKDIALVILDKPVVYSKAVSPVCVDSTLNPGKDTCYLASWSVAVDLKTNVLHQIGVQILDDKRCDEKLADGTYDARLHSCAWTVDGNMDPCDLDSGTPVFCQKKDKWYLYSISAFYINCNREGVPGFYTKVGHYYADWLHNTDQSKTATVSPIILPTTSSPTTKNPGPKCGDPEYTPLKDIREDAVQTRIAHGNEALPHSWPWQAAIFRHRDDGGYVYECGGTLIAPSKVLTAGHCKLYSNDPSKYKVVLGAHNLNVTAEGQIEAKVKNYTEADGNNVKRNQWPKDVAVITLQNPVPFGETVSPACLPPTGGKRLKNGTLCYVVGWGRKSSNGETSSLLQQGGVLIRNDCQSLYKTFDPETMLCAGDDRIDTCGGDSGGPLMCEVNGRWYIYGITSLGVAACGTGKPAIYSEVAYYEKWISKFLTI